MTKVVIHTDGGADPNPGVGGWAAVLRAGGREKVLTGSEAHTTNNRMELTAAIAALEALRRPSQVEFHTDSEYLRKGITEWIARWAAAGWRRKGRPIANADLWRKLWSLVQQHQIAWHWVRAHTGNRANERVDALARRARLAITPEAQVSAEAPRLYLRATCRSNPGPGAWGVILERGEDVEQQSGSEPQTTNNRMELTAAIEGLRMLPPGSSVQAYTASDYLYQGATRWIHGWRQRDWKKRDGQPVANADLWRELDERLQLVQVRWINAKGDMGREIPALAAAARAAAAAMETVA